jgi:hypothetical protein
MLTPGRILLVAALVALVYFGWFALPPGPRTPGQFDPDAAAAAEVAAWRSAQGHEDFGVYLHVTELLRELHRYNWFRAAQAGFSLGRATTTFSNIHGHYDRLLPDLEEAARIEKEWLSASYDPAAVAKAELSWWIAQRLPTENNVDALTRLIAIDYALRYTMSPGQVTEAARNRAQALLLVQTGGVDPDWPGITRVLTESYRSLHGAIQQDETARHLRQTR